MQPLLCVKDFCVRFPTMEGLLCAVNGVSFALHSREILGIVGESGSGKSQLFNGILRLLPKNAIASGDVLFNGQSVSHLNATEFNQFRSYNVGIVFQDPMTALNPYLTIGRQLTEVLEFHKGFSPTRAHEASVEMLDAVKMPHARKIMTAYPHELSGGMRQRVLIAMALMCHPKVLIADEPTTALDVTVQSQIMDLLRELQQEFDMSVILITHDLGLVGNIADRIIVMYAGRVLETGETKTIFGSPWHPYTQALLASAPRLDAPVGSLVTIPGNPPNLIDLPQGCPFQPRCPLAEPRCRAISFVPQAELKSKHYTSCPYHEAAYQAGEMI